MFQTNQSMCPIGTYCVDGVQKLCPAGVYGSDPGLATAACSGLCASGHYCPSGSTVPERFQCGGAHVFCPAGSSTPTTVPVGEYSVGGASERTRNGSTACEAGRYCSAGVAQDCPGGRFG